MAFGAIAGYGEGETPPSHIDQSPLIVCAVMLGCAWVTILLRLYTRIFLVYALGWDDIFIILSLASFTVYSGGEMTVSLKRNLLDHLPMPSLKSATEGYILHLIFYVVTITFLKLSVGVFLVRIANRKDHRRIIYLTMAVSTIWGLATTILVIFQCGYPRSIDYYIAQRLAGTCISGDIALGFGYSWAAVTCLSDIAFTVLPVFILRDAQINRRARIVLTGLLTMGALGSIASLIRFAYVKELKVVNNRFFLESMKLGIWSSVECGLAISAASLATLRPMFRKLLQGAQTIGNRTKESFSAGQSGGGSGKRGRDTIKMTESQSRSFVHRFSLSSRRATMSTAKRLSDIEDVEIHPLPPKPVANSSTADSASIYEADEQHPAYGSPGSQTMRQPRSPLDASSPAWSPPGRTSKETAYDSRHKSYGLPISRYSERYSSDHIREGGQF